MIEGRVTYLDRMPEADAAYGRMPRTPRDTASTYWEVGCIRRSALARAEQASPSKMRPTLTG